MHRFRLLLLFRSLAALACSFSFLIAGCERPRTAVTFRGDLAVVLALASEDLNKNGRLEQAHADRLRSLIADYSEVLAGSETLEKLEFLAKTVERGLETGWPQGQTLVYNQNKASLMNRLDVDYPR